MIQDVGKAIAKIRRDKGLSQEELAELAMISRISVARYETGKFEPGAQALNRIADALEVSTDELLGRPDRVTPFVNINRDSVPIIGEIACGTPITAEQNVSGYADLPEGVRADFALLCKGDSMTPTFNDGDLVLIHAQPEVEPGQIAAVGIDGAATLKHLYPQQTGILCVSDNPQYPPQFYPAGEITVYGLAVGFVRMF